jgi:hypothetical protein
MLRISVYCLLILALIQIVLDPFAPLMVIYGAGAIVFISWAAIIYLYGRVRSLEERLDDAEDFSGQLDEEMSTFQRKKRQRY